MIDTACSVLDATTWRSQYYLYDEAVIVEDFLAFGGGGTFEQDLVAYPFQNCTQNAVAWVGDFDVAANQTSILLTYTRCTPSGSGCIRCEPTQLQWITVRFSTDCDVLQVTSPENAFEERTYVADDVRHRANF